MTWIPIETRTLVSRIDYVENLDTAQEDKKDRAKRCVVCHLHTKCAPDVYIIEDPFTSNPITRVFRVAIAALCGRKPGCECMDNEWTVLQTENEG